MQTEKIGVLEAKTRFSGLLEAVQGGTVFQITKHGKVIAELRSAREQKIVPKLGFAKGMFKNVAEDFDEPIEDFREYMG